MAKPQALWVAQFFQSGMHEIDMQHTIFQLSSAVRLNPTHFTAEARLEGYDAAASDIGGYNRVLAKAWAA